MVATHAVLLETERQSFVEEHAIRSHPALALFFESLRHRLSQVFLLCHLSASGRVDVQTSLFQDGAGRTIPGVFGWAVGLVPLPGNFSMRLASLTEMLVAKVGSLVSKNGGENVVLDEAAASSLLTNVTHADAIAEHVARAVTLRWARQLRLVRLDPGLDDGSTSTSTNGIQLVQPGQRPGWLAALVAGTTAAVTGLSTKTNPVELLAELMAVRVLEVLHRRDVLEAVMNASSSVNNTVASGIGKKRDYVFAQLIVAGVGVLDLVEDPPSFVQQLHNFRRLREGLFAVQVSDPSLAACLVEQGAQWTPATIFNNCALQLAEGNNGNDDGQPARPVAIDRLEHSTIAGVRDASPIELHVVRHRLVPAVFVFPPPLLELFGPPSRRRRGVDLVVARAAPPQADAYRLQVQQPQPDDLLAMMQRLMAEQERMREDLAKAEREAAAANDRATKADARASEAHEQATRLLALQQQQQQQDQDGSLATSSTPANGNIAAQQQRQLQADVDNIKDTLASYGQAILAIAANSDTRL